MFHTLSNQFGKPNQGDRLEGWIEPMPGIGSLQPSQQSLRSERTQNLQSPGESYKFITRGCICRLKWLLVSCLFKQIYLQFFWVKVARPVSVRRLRTNSACPCVWLSVCKQVGVSRLQWDSYQEHPTIALTIWTTSNKNWSTVSYMQVQMRRGLCSRRADSPPCKVKKLKTSSPAACNMCMMSW